MVLPVFTATLSIKIRGNALFPPVKCQVRRLGEGRNHPMHTYTPIGHYGIRISKILHTQP